MNLSQLHFAHPLWLWGAIVIPLGWILFFIFRPVYSPIQQLEKFIDKHLLPYLWIDRTNKKSSRWIPLLLWSLAWFCLILALTGPRWNFREIETFSRDQSLVILLDLSESMNGTDTKPSRLVRAKQKIEDLIAHSKGVKIGLIAFAADPHMITPLTDDKETVRHLLPSLETDLAYVQGSRLSPALDMADTLLKVEPSNNKSILVISDGGFEDAAAFIKAKKMAENDIVIHAMGVGTPEGTPLRDRQGNIIKRNNTPILSKLEKERLLELTQMGHGLYLEALYSDQAEDLILQELEKRAEAHETVGKKKQFWDEGFYFLILPILPILLWWFRRGHIFAMILLPFLFSPAFELRANPIQHYFKNSEELGKQAMDDGDYETAINSFQDPYRKGVACYRAGAFAEAEKMFRQSSREDVSCNAAYNLGNALVQQQKLKEAITAYEEVLKRWPDHIKAKENLELVKKMLEQQQQDHSNSDNSDEKDQNKDTDQQQKDGSDEHSGAPEDNSQTQEKKDSHQEKGDQQKENNQDHSQPEEQEQINQAEESKQVQGEAKDQRSQEDQDADLWLNQISDDPKPFLKNKFYIESKKNGTKEGIDPW